jgi:hypothetical protein
MHTRSIPLRVTHAPLLGQSPEVAAGAEQRREQNSTVRPVAVVLARHRGASLPQGSWYEHAW